MGSQAEPPHTTAAAPITDAEGVVAAVSVVARSSEFSAAACVPAVRAAARAISREMSRAS
jgi:DNA-binding IclR family transcriptional regulator